MVILLLLLLLFVGCLKLHFCLWLLLYPFFSLWVKHRFMLLHYTHTHTNINNTTNQKNRVANLVFFFCLLKMHNGTNIQVLFFCFNDFCCWKVLCFVQRISLFISFFLFLVYCDDYNKCDFLTDWLLCFGETELGEKKARTKHKAQNAGWIFQCFFIIQFRSLWEKFQSHWEISTLLSQCLNVQECLVFLKTRNIKA